MVEESIRSLMGYNNSVQWNLNKWSLLNNNPSL